MGGLHSWPFSFSLFLASSLCLGCFSSIGWYWSAAAQQPLGKSRIDRSGWSTKRSLRRSWAQARGFTGGSKLHPAKYAATGSGTKQTRTCRDCGRKGLGAPQEVGSSGMEFKGHASSAPRSVQSPQGGEKRWCPFGRRAHSEGLYGMGKSYTWGALWCSRRDVFGLLLTSVGCLVQCLGFWQASLVSVFPQEVPEGPVPGEWAVGRGTLCPRGLQAPTPCLRGHVQLHPGL